MSASMAAPSGGSNKLAAFRPNTRQRVATIGSVSAAAGTQQSITFPQVGLMESIFLFCNTTFTDSATTPAVTASTFGPFNLLKRVTGITNLGTATIFDLSGYGCQLVDNVLYTASNLRGSNADVVAGNTTDPLYNYPTTFTSATAKAVTFVLFIPVAANNGPQFHIGLLNLQAPEIRFTLQLTFSPSLAGAATTLPDAYVSSDGGTYTLGGSVYVYYRYYEVPNPARVQLPPRILHRLLEDRTPILATGDTTYLVPRQGILLQAIHNVVIAGVVDQTATNVTGRRLVFNKTDTAYKFDYIFDRISNRLNYGYSSSGASQMRDLPAGAYVWEFFDADLTPSSGDLRDVIDTEALSTLESFITLASGASLGTSNNFIDTVRRITQNY
jgi:hypothetical protein